MRFFTLSLLLSAVLVFRIGATPILPGFPQPTQAGPTISCPGDTLLQSDVFSCGAAFTYTVTASDDLPGWTLTQTAGLASGEVFPVGETVNTFLVTDTDGNTAECSFTVTVVDDIPPNVVAVEYTQIFIPPYDDPNDCYDGYVVTLPAWVFDDGSYDNCGGNLKITVRRLAPYSSFILGLNPVNGHPDCDDLFPDFPSEFERAVSEYDSIKFYCGEAGVEQYLIIRAYQLDANGDIDLDINGNPIYNEALTAVAFVESSILCEEPDLSAQLGGAVTLDANGDCAPDADVLGLSNMIVEAKNASGETFYTVTGTEGTYSLSNLPEGLTEVKVVPYLPIWDICNNQASVNLPVAPSATQLDFNALPALSCPLLTVDIASEAIVLCSTNTWRVAYSNKGNVTAENATVEISAKAPFILVNANKPFTIAGETMTVQVGDLKPGATGEFEVNIQAPCDAALAGQNLCVEAAVAPVSNCLPTSPAWSGAQIEATSVCTGDSIHFTLKNTGTAPTSQNLEFVIIDDMVVMFSGQIPAGLPVQGEFTYTVYAQGHSIRIQAEQEPGHPLAQNPSLTLENCNGATTNSPMLQFHNEDGNPFTDQECRQVVAASNLSEMLTFPQGLTSQHVIEKNTRITYQVNFRNTGNDAVSVVVIQDEIPALLNPADVHPGAASHPYTWSLSGSGTLEVRFEPISLPAGAGGFIQFDIAQDADNPDGAVIENKASVYFDIDPPFQTNTVFHTIGKGFLGTSGVSRFNIDNQVVIYPNPASEQAFLRIDEPGTVRVRLVNMLGQKVTEMTGKTPGITLSRGKMQSGVYQVEVLRDGRWIQGGKLIWE